MKDDRIDEIHDMISCMPCDLHTVKMNSLIKAVEKLWYTFVILLFISLGLGVLILWMGR